MTYYISDLGEQPGLSKIYDSFSTFSHITVHFLFVLQFY